MKKYIFAILLVIIIALGASFLISQRANAPNKQGESSNASSSGTKGNTVDLSGQQLTAFPESLGNLVEIRVLNLSNNQLTSLPASITKLVNLEVLNVENNRLESLPGEISQLKNLREIHANNNRMTSLPAELQNMTQLKVLDISGNSIPQSQIEQLKSSLTHTEIKT